MRAAGLIFLTLSLLALAPRLAAQDLYGTRVVEVSIDGAEPAALADLPLQPGDLLTRSAVRAAIQTLYDRGRFSRIAVEAVPADGGSRLTFRVEAPFFLSSVRMDPPNLLERSLSGYLDLPYGGRLSSATVETLTDSVRRQMEEEGYFAATITPRVVQDEATRLASVVIEVDAGPPASVGGVSFSGEALPFAADELERAFDIEPGSRFRADLIREGEERLRTLFLGDDGTSGYVDTVIDVGRTWRGESNTVDLVVEIEAGPRVELEVAGARLESSRLRELVPVFEEGSIDADLIEEGRANLLEYFIREGYHDAAVSVSYEPLEEAGSEIRILFEVESGPRYSVRSFAVNGNTVFEDGIIRQETELSAGGLFSRGTFSPRLLEEAIRSVRALYAASGYSGTEVEVLRALEGRRVDLTMEIREGIRPIVGRVEVSGNETLSRDEVILAGDVFEGESYVPGEVEAARRALVSRYHGLGYSDARVQAVVSREGGSGPVVLSYQIEEGSPSRIGSIFVAGATRTRQSVIRRQAEAEIREGAAYDPEALLEAQRALYATGLFERVDIVTLDRGDAGSRDVLIHVEDAAPILLTYGVGVQQGVELEQGGGDDVDVRATVELSHTNLWGLGRSLSARIRGSRREQRFQTTYREPRLFNWDLDGFASFLIERTRRPQFDASRIDFSIQSLYQFPNEDNLLFTASFQTVNLRDIRVNPRAGTTDEIGTIQVSTIGASWVRDTRNAPFDPTRGNYFSGSFRLGHRAYGSEVNFTSVFTQVSLFRPARQTVIAGSARFGWNQPFGRAGDGSPQRLPITERYFAGGSTTLRAFDVDEAGVPGGGNALFLLNLEYRYPLPLFLPGLSGAVFYDTGTVFDRISDFSVGDFTHTSGLGLRYLTPLGPVRVDFGLNLNRQESIGERAHRLHFTLGHAF